jgi:hypothetical protein
LNLERKRKEKKRAGKQMSWEIYHCKLELGKAKEVIVIGWKQRRGRGVTIKTKHNGTRKWWQDRDENDGRGAATRVVSIALITIGLVVALRASRDDTSFNHHVCATSRNSQKTP